MTLLNKVTTDTIHFLSSSSFNSTEQNASGTEILILLLYLAVQLDLRTVTDWIEEAESKVFAMFTVQLKNVYGDSLVLLVQRSYFQTSSWS